MNNQIKYIINVVATGIFVIVLLGIVFFWADRLCDSSILDSVKPNDYGINISPSRLIPNENQLIKEYADKDQSYFPSSITTSMKYGMVGTLGMFRDIEQEDTRSQDLTMMTVAYDIVTDNVSSTIKPEILENHSNQRTYFDKNNGLFVNCTFRNNIEGKHKWIKKINYYIGPEGIDDEPSEQIGKFISPLISEIKNSYNQTVVFYDTGLGRFFRIKITNEEKSVIKGPELDSEKYNPIQTGHYYIEKSNIFVYNNFNSPGQFVEVDGKRNNIPIDQFFNPTSNKYLIVLNSNNRIDLLDTETLELKPAGNLPEYIKLQGGYFIRPVFFKDNYAGLIISTISSNFRYMDTYVFDTTGKEITRKSIVLNDEKVPGGIASISGRYIIESLQPAGFNILSYLAANNYDGTKSQQAMFIRPNSNIARITTIARLNKMPLLIELFQALMITGPSLFIGILLGWRISKKAKALGLSEQAVRLWTYGTIFTGIAGYITFMLTKPAEMMVTCKNCGQLRRVDHETCHNCKADWQMKHLKAADWRIIGA